MMCVASDTGAKLAVMMDSRSRRGVESCPVESLMLRLRSMGECGDRTEQLEGLSRHTKHHKTVGELGNR